MKPFTVTCDAVTRTKLATFFQTHFDPESPTYDAAVAAQITRASDAIDQELARAPLTVGTQMIGNVRVYVVRPLAVVYAVYPDCLVIPLEYRLCPTIP